MATSYTSLLGFALPVTGELQGTWGDTVNNSITQLAEDSIAGVATASVASGDWTLSTTGSGATNEARKAILIPTGSPGVSRNIICPSKSKAYVVVNQSNAAVVVKGAATTGVTISAGVKALVAWNGSDFVQVTGDLTAYAPLASPTFTGTPAAPTAAANTNTTQLATTAFVLGQGNATGTTIAMNGTQAAGTSDLYARADHVHPTDTSRQASLGFTPVQQGTGTGQLGNTVKIGWSAASRLKATVDTTDLGNIVFDANLASYAPLASPALTGSPTAPTQAANDNSTKVATTAYADAAAAANVASSKIQPITASVGSNALTLTLNATKLDFRSSTLSSGTVNTRTISSPISVVVSSGSTLGTINATAARLAVIAIDNAGTVELAVSNLAGGVNLDETTLISTTAEGGAGAADSASVIYSTTARTNVPFRVVGFVDITEATAGTWASAPTTVQGIGGQALSAMSSLGYGQTWQTVTRTSGVTYYNTTGRPILFCFSGSSSGANGYLTIIVNGTTVMQPQWGSSVASGISATILIPPVASYSYTNVGYVSVITTELR